MGIILGDNQYGKAENRVVRIVRDTARHEIRDVNVSTGCAATSRRAYLVGDQSNVLPTDTQKQTAYAFAKEVGIDHRGLRDALARHFVDDIAPVDALASRSRSTPGSACRWAAPSTTTRGVRRAGGAHRVRHRRGQRGAEQRIAGLRDLKDHVILKSTGSEFTAS